MKKIHPIWHKKKCRKRAAWVMALLCFLSSGASLNIDTRAAAIVDGVDTASGSVFFFLQS
jgi:hypothetical protein